MQLINVELSSNILIEISTYYIYIYIYIYIYNVNIRV